jgi:hypothetical protein
MRTAKWIIIVLVACLSIMACSKILEDISPSDKGSRDMDWYYKRNAYAIMTVMDTRDKPVMELIAIPLNSEALLPLVREDIGDVQKYIKRRIKHQRPVIYITAHAHRDCCFFWPVFMLQQGQGRVYPASVIPAQSQLVAAAGRLFERYGERRVREVDRYMGLVTNPYTGRDMLELSKEIELVQGESVSAVAVFGGGLRLNQPFRLVCKGRRFVLSNGDIYTTREVSRPVKVYVPEGQDLPGEDIYKHTPQDEYRTGRKQGRLRERDAK